MFEITWFTIDLQTFQVWENTFPNNYECLCLKKEKGKERNDERRKGGKIEWNVAWSKTWVNLLVVELGQFDHSRSFLRIHNPREYRFFQLETPFLGKHKGSTWFHGWKILAFLRTRVENDISDAWRRVTRLKKILHTRFFPREKRILREHTKMRKCFSLIEYY